MLEIMRAAAPYLTFLLAIIIGLIGWIVTRLSKETDRLSQAREDDERYMHEHYVTQDQFYKRVGENQRTLEDIFQQLKTMNATLNQIVGENRAYENVRRDLMKLQGKEPK